jgi:predicted metal-binding membrane protein
MTVGRVRTVAVLLVVAAAGWVAVAARGPMMMDGALPYLGTWIAMTVAMMLPSAAPMLLLVDRLSPSATTPFASAYLLVWAAVGIAAYAWTSRVTLGGTALVLAAAGVYQLLPAKRACLRRCRHPLPFLRDHSGERPFVVGLRHGAFCVGCCAGLMAVLVALGMASIAWMVVVGAVILAEKALPQGEALATASAVALLGAAAVMVAS